VDLLDLAEEDINGHPLWNYYDKTDPPEDISEDEEEPQTCGAAIECFVGESGKACYQYTRKLPNGHKAWLERHVSEFVVGLNCMLKDHIPEVLLQTKHTWGGETFQAHTWFQGGIWCNWVFIDWGKEHGILLASRPTTTS
jgi:hypothetical protein